MKIHTFANPFSLKCCSYSNISLVLWQKNMYTQYPWHLNFVCQCVTGSLGIIDHRSKALSPLIFCVFSVVFFRDGRKWNFTPLVQDYKSRCHLTEMIRNKRPQKIVTVIEHFTSLIFVIIKHSFTSHQASITKCLTTTDSPDDKHL